MIRGSFCDIDQKIWLTTDNVVTCSNFFGCVFVVGFRMKKSNTISSKCECECKYIDWGLWSEEEYHDNQHAIDLVCY